MLHYICLYYCIWCLPKRHYQRNSVVTYYTMPVSYYPYVIHSAYLSKELLNVAFILCFSCVPKMILEGNIHTLRMVVHLGICTLIYTYLTHTEIQLCTPWSNRQLQHICKPRLCIRSHSCMSKLHWKCCMDRSKTNCSAQIIYCWKATCTSAICLTWYQHHSTHFNLLL